MKPSFKGSINQSLFLNRIWLALFALLNRDFSFADYFLCLRKKYASLKNQFVFQVLNILMSCRYTYFASSADMNNAIHPGFINKPPDVALALCKVLKLICSDGQLLVSIFHNVVLAFVPRGNFDLLRVEGNQILDNGHAVFYVKEGKHDHIAEREKHIFKPLLAVLLPRQLLQGLDHQKKL